MRRFGFLFLAILLLPLPVMARPVIADLSDYQIRIDASFTGTSLLLFGARNAPGDIVIAVRGPQKKFVVRKKKRFLGMWVNQYHATYPLVPDYYAIAASKPLDKIKAKKLFEALQITTDHLPLTPVEEISADQRKEFAEALKRFQTSRQLYVNEATPASFMGETLFKTQIPFPDSIPRGIYTAEVYLIEDGQLRGVQVLPIEVLKIGFDAWLYDLAYHYSVIYGLLAIILAVGAGWAANHLFRKT